MAAPMLNQGGVCMYCGAECKSRSGFNRHVRKHENNAPYKCCGKQFFDKNKLVMHRCSKHGRLLQRMCDICEKNFATEQQLQQHNNLVHSETRYKCDTCGVDLKSKTSLNDHQSKHAGEKPHKCSCGKSYQYASGLYRHKREKDHT